jgi:hypothetical protein
MTQTKKATASTNGSRKGPTESATKFSVGVTKKGNDGKLWTIISTASGVHRWAKAPRTQTQTQSRRHRSRNTTAKKSKRVLEMEADPTTVWGKNKPLEKLWQELASGKKVVLITKKDGSHSGSRSRIFTMPTTPAADKKQYIEFDEDPNIIAVLSSNQSQDAYEVYLYPKAKDKSVEYVIKNYKKFFKPMSHVTGPTMMIKVLVPA